MLHRTKAVLGVIAFVVEWLLMNIKWHTAVNVLHPVTEPDNWKYLGCNWQKLLRAHSSSVLCHLSQLLLFNARPC